MACERSVPGGSASEIEGVCVPGQGQCGEGVLRPPVPEGQTALDVGLGMGLSSW